MLATLQILNDRKASDGSQYVTNLRTGAWRMYVDYMRAWQKPAWANL